VSEEIEVLAIKRIDEDRRVAHVRVGEITIRSLWIVGCAGNKPRTSWPETSKGYPIVEAGAELKARIDRLVFESAGIETPKPKRAKRAPRRRAPTKARPPLSPEFDDPLDDILGGAG